MNQNCSMIRDLLPLYLENMVSPDTAACVKAHLESCPACAEAYRELTEKSGVEAACPPKADGVTEGIAGLRSVKRRLKKRNAAIACAAIAATLLLVCAVAWLRPPTRDYGQSDMYKAAEIGAAMDTVTEQVATWEGCRLYSLYYAGDNVSREELEYINSLAAEDRTYTDCMVIRAEFRSPIFGGGGWNANFVYHWTWYLGRTGKGSWEPVTWGAP